MPRLSPKQIASGGASADEILIWDSVAGEWKAGAQAGSPTAAWIYLYRTALLDMPNANTWVDLPWNIAAPAKNNVTHAHDSFPKNITIVTAGTYLISWEAQHHVNNSEGRVGTRLLKNSTELPGSWRRMGAISNHRYLFQACGSMIAELAVDDVIVLQVSSRLAGDDIECSGEFGAAPVTLVAAAISLHKIPSG